MHILSILKTFRPTHLIQQFVVIVVLDCIQFRVGIAPFLDELPCLLGGVQVWLPVSRAVDVPADTHLTGLLRSEDFLVL